MAKCRVCAAKMGTHKGTKNVWTGSFICHLCSANQAQNKAVEQREMAAARREGGSPSSTTRPVIPLAVGDSATCETCDKTFSSDAMLRVHQSRDHQVKRTNGNLTARQGLIAFAVLGLFGGLFIWGAATYDPDAARVRRQAESLERLEERATRTDSPRTTSAVRNVVVPTMLGDNLRTAMNQHTNIQFAWRDLAPDLVPSRVGERRRNVFDTSNWRILAQCHAGQTVSSRTDVTVGVVQEDELRHVDAATILNGGYNVLMTC